MGNEKTSKGKKDERTPVDRLAEIADAIFERATKLDGIKLVRRDDEAAQTIADTRDDAFRGCIQVWRVILQLLPTSDLDQSARGELSIDAHKVVSRCFHRLDRLDEAKIEIAKAIDLGYAEGFISLGAICLDQGQHEEAESAFKSALAKDVQTMRAHAGLGELYFKMGTEKLKQDPKHTAYFVKAEEEFIAAGKERFTEGFDRAMDLFETLGWRERAATVGLRAAKFYEEHKGSYGEKLRALNNRLRKLAGEARHDRLVDGVGRKLGAVLGGRKGE